MQSADVHYRLTESVERATLQEADCFKRAGHWTSPDPHRADLTANIGMPRAPAQEFYQFDELFRDNAIVLPGPMFLPLGPPVQDNLNGDGIVSVADVVELLAAWDACPAMCLPTRGIPNRRCRNAFVFP